MTNLGRGRASRSDNIDIRGNIDNDCGFAILIRLGPVFRAFPLRRLQLDPAADAQHQPHRQADNKQHRAQQHQQLQTHIADHLQVINLPSNHPRAAQQQGSIALLCSCSGLDSGLVWMRRLTTDRSLTDPLCAHARIQDTAEFQLRSAMDAQNVAFFISYQPKPTWLAIYEIVRAPA